MQDEQALATNPSSQMRLATDVAGLCREIVQKTAITIQKKQYVKVEGWMAIATAYGCVAGATNVQQVLGGVSATGELRKISDGTLIGQAEGFVGEDEPKWFGGEMEVWDRTSPTGKTMRELPPRPMYAIRAMAQTRAISRVCRSAFAHVVVLIDEKLSTTPAEEVPSDGFHDHTQPTDEEITDRQERREKAARAIKEDPVNAALQEASTSTRKKKS